MASFKSYPVFFTTLGVLGLAALGAGWAIVDRHAAAEKSMAQLAQKHRDLDSVNASKPAPTSANKEAVEADLQRTEVALGKMRNELKGGAVAEEFAKAPVPTTPTNAFFNLETFVQSMRQKLKAAGVSVKPDERFGFATYQSEGPQPELIGRVFQQRQVAEYLLGALIDARPSELVSFQRERPLTKAEIAARQNQQPGASRDVATHPDFFEIDSRISARVPGFVDATAFRLTFVGDTSTLRKVLNKLGSFELPLVVRSVEVEPSAARASDVPEAPAASGLDAIFGGASAGNVGAPAPETIKPLVEKLPSKFTVTVELIDLVEAPANEATPTS